MHGLVDALAAWAAMSAAQLGSYAARALTTIVGNGRLQPCRRRAACALPVRVFGMNAIFLSTRYKMGPAVS